MILTFFLWSFYGANMFLMFNNIYYATCPARYPCALASDHSNKAELSRLSAKRQQPGGVRR